MTTLSIIATKYGRVRGGEDSVSDIRNSFFSNSTIRSLSRSLNRVWLRNVEGSTVRSGKKFCVAAKIKKGKKHDYPWPDDMDPNCENPLKYLSYFKPLDKQPKPVTLEFEKPLVDLEKQIMEVGCFFIQLVLVMYFLMQLNI